MGGSSRKQRLIISYHVILSALAILFVGVLSWGLMGGNLVAVVVAGVGLATIITMASSNLLASDDQRSQATERTLRVASAPSTTCAEA